MVGLDEPRGEECAVRVIQGMYSNGRSPVQVNGQYSEMEALSGDPSEITYIDDLVLIADTQGEYISKPKAWKAGMESKGLHVNMEKTMFLVSGVGHDVLKKSGKYPCAVCCSGVDNNSIHCSQCMLWVHKKCGGITKHWWPTKTMSVAGVMARHDPSMRDLWLKWMSTAPGLMRKPLSAT